jgi:hypothetical protein
MESVESFSEESSSSPIDFEFSKEQIDKAWVITYSGQRFNILQPKAEDVNLTDIACSLARQARFNGHTQFFYSVGQHSCYGAQVSPTDEIAKLMLFHDASEAYVGDLVSPIKALLPHYELIEDRIQKAIADRFEFEFPFPKVVKEIDRRLLATEVRDLITPRLETWTHLEQTPFDFRINPWPPQFVESRFLEWAFELGISK